MAVYHGDIYDNTWNGTTGNDSAYGYAGNDVLNGKDGNDTLWGGDGADSLIGGKGDDTLYGGAGGYWGGAWHGDTLAGWAGNDTMVIQGHGGVISGQTGNDILEAKKIGFGQYHFYGGQDDDTLIMHMNNQQYWGHQGHHVYGGVGSDSFQFTSFGNTTKDLGGRIDDFDYSRDSIKIGGVQVDLANLPATVAGQSLAIVEFNGQQWLRINNNILYTLEGARLKSNSGGTDSNSEEVHFTALPANIGALSSVAYIDQVNFVPFDLYETREVNNTLNLIETAYNTGTPGAVNLGSINGTSGDDHIYAIKGSVTVGGTNYLISSQIIKGFAGDDVIDGNSGNDKIYGGNGNDLIAGGLDNDTLWGQNGNDHLYGGSEKDKLYGGNGNDILEGGTGNDVLVGNAGHDDLRGGTGNDVLHGHNGNDTLSGESGNDRIYGNTGNDTAYGAGGNDKIWGAGGEDVLHGGGGNDIINGGQDRDVVWGKAGNDIFEFKTGELMDWDDLTGTWAQKNNKLDLIADFVIGNDKIEFDHFANVSSMADLMSWKTTLNGNVHFTVQVRATNERILVDVDDNTTWSQFFDAGNFTIL